LAAASVGLLCGIKLEGIKRELEKLEPQPSRLNIVFGSSGSTIIDDSYNASPVGAVAAIETLKEYPGRRKIAVLGEMKELGSHSEMGHRQVGKTLVVAKIDYLVSFGELTKFVVDEAIKQGMKKDHIFQVKTMKEVIKVLKKIIRPGDVILLKGSRFSHMERVILGIEGKEINCDLVTCREYKPCSLCCKSKCSF
jgi:UDP-N-acetylmuramoyl-tripeptide--D-alanyl-D-alanine ligase